MASWQDPNRTAYSSISAGGSAIQHNGNQEKSYFSTLCQEDRDKLLLRAAAEGQLRRLTLLLHAGASVDYHDTNRRRALHLAVLNGHDDCTEQLLHYGADINARGHADEDATALWHAAQKCNDAMVELLIKNKADVNIPGGKSRMPVLSWAAKYGRKETAKLLLDKGANVDAKSAHYSFLKDSDLTALHCAVSNGNPAVVQLLLERKAPVEAKTKWGQTALHLAASNARLAVVRLLLERKAQIAAKTPGCYTALHLAARAGHHAVVELLLLQKGAYIEAKNFTNSTALNLMADSGHEATVRLLLDKGANIENENDIGCNPLRDAAFWRHDPVVRLLLAKGADINSRTTRRENFVKLKNGTIDYHNRYGLTALHLAARRGHEMTVQLLLQKGANALAKDVVEKSTARDLADLGNHERVVRILQEAEDNPQRYKIL